MPAVGDEVLYAVNLLGSLMQIHCRVTAVLEANEVSGGGWECTLEYVVAEIVAMKGSPQNFIICPNCSIKIAFSLT